MNALFIKSDTGENNESDVRNVNGQTTSGENNENVDDSDSQLNTGIDLMSLNNSFYSQVYKYFLDFFSK